MRVLWLARLHRRLSACQLPRSAPPVRRPLRCEPVIPWPGRQPRNSQQKKRLPEHWWQKPPMSHDGSNNLLCVAARHGAKGAVLDVRDRLSRQYLRPLANRPLSCQIDQSIRPTVEAIRQSKRGKACLLPGGTVVQFQFKVPLPCQWTQAPVPMNNT